MATKMLIHSLGRVALFTPFAEYIEKCIKNQAFMFCAFEKLGQAHVGRERLGAWRTMAAIFFSVTLAAASKEVACCNAVKSWGEAAAVSTILYHFPVEAPSGGFGRVKLTDFLREPLSMMKK